MIPGARKFPELGAAAEDSRIGELKAAEAIPRELTLEASPLVAEQEVPSIEDLATPEQPDIGSAADDFRSALD